VYLREPRHCDAVLATLRAHLPSNTPLLVLAADICRQDLLIEIDGLHTQSESAPAARAWVSP
jgi:chorismate lyase / 3-hydroxybenzoate synthase